MSRCEPLRVRATASASHREPLRVRAAACFRLTRVSSRSTQATIEMLETATKGQPRHPLRKALGDNFTPISKVCKEDGLGDKYPKVQQGLEHFCKLRQFAPPEFLRKMVSEEVQDNMPEGLIVQRLMLRVATLNGMMTGSDMVKVSLSALAINVMGHGIPQDTRDAIKDMLEEAQTMKAAGVLEKVNDMLASMPVTSIMERSAKSGVQRLSDRLTEILEGRMPECPVMLETPTLEEARIMRCCTAIISCKALDRLHTCCPLCKEPFEHGQEVGTVQLPSLSPPTSPPMSPSMMIERKRERAERGEESSSEEEEEQDGKCQRLERDAILERKFTEISEKRMQTVDGIIAALNAQLDHNASSRILLCFAFEAHQRAVVRQMVSRIKREVGGGEARVTDIEDIARNAQKAGEAMVHFDNAKAHPEPQIFIFNTRAKTSNVQGMDLHATDLTIVADECDLAVQRQAAGRSLRMRKRPSSMPEDEKFPKKRILVATIRYN